MTREVMVLFLVRSPCGACGRQPIDNSLIIDASLPSSPKSVKTFKWTRAELAALRQPQVQLGWLGHGHHCPDECQLPSRSEPHARLAELDLG